LLLEQKFGDIGNLLFGRDNDSDNTAVNFGGLESVEQLLKSEYLDGVVDVHNVEIFIILKKKNSLSKNCILNYPHVSHY